MHMPGHKGNPILGPEPLDITEITGADVLYASHGIIRESEENAAHLFGSARTLYSAEGSSLCIRAMLYLAEMDARRRGLKKAKIAAGRNAHRVFLEAAALLDTDLYWLRSGDGLLSAAVEASALEGLFQNPENAPTAVYVTSPDYLGQCVYLREIADVCHRHGALLLVDNAHGAYLKFLPESRHPLDLGADLCCDSAHKTLPVLTGGAYLHCAKRCPDALVKMAERAMALFASTSPSWLILQSLDKVNALLAEGYPEKINRTVGQMDNLKIALLEAGWTLAGEEPLKLSLCPKPMGYTGEALAEMLEEQGFVCEFADPDYLVLMATPEIGDSELKRLKNALVNLERREAIPVQPPKPGIPEAVLTPREAMLSLFESIPSEESEGRILASPSVSCPPAVPVCICGERIDQNALMLFRYYGIKSCDVVLQ